MKTASWIIRNKETKEVICETFNDPTNKLKSIYEAIPILEYLQGINDTIKKEQNIGE